MRTWKQSMLLASLFLLSFVIMPPFVVAQTSDGLPEAREGTSAGSLAVMLEFMVDHDPAFYAEDAVFHVMAMPEPYVGREAIGAALATFYGGAFTDTHVELRTILADGTRVVLEFVYNGTHSGELMGMPATGQRVRVPMLGIYEIEGDHIREGRLYYDAATMMAQLRPTE